MPGPVDTTFQCTCISFKTYRAAVGSKCQRTKQGWIGACRHRHMLFPKNAVTWYRLKKNLWYRGMGNDCLPASCSSVEALQ